jgi:hypothetical protein
MDTDAFIDAHPQAALIRRIQRTAYRGYSWRHKNGLDGLSFFLGPAAPFGFAMVSDHREEQSRQCREAVEKLLATLGHSVADRRIVALLLADYPGRDHAIRAQLRAHLDQQV